MPVDGTKYRALAITLGLLAVATAAGAGSRQAAMRPADDALQPREDGTYWLPISGMESVTLRFEPGDVPVELVAIRIDEENDSIVADLRYTGEKVVTAWQVKLASVDATGHEDSALSVGTDWGPMGDPRLDPLPGYRVYGGPREVEGPIHPGDVRSVDLGSASGPDLEELVLSVALLVFEDTTWIGSQRLARQTLERRSMEAEEHARWLERIGRILESTSSERELTRALEDLVAEMEEIPDSPDRGTAAAVRHTLQDNLRALAQAAPGSPVSKREQLRDLALSERRHLEEAARLGG